MWQETDAQHCISISIILIIIVLGLRVAVVSKHRWEDELTSKLFPQQNTGTRGDLNGIDSGYIIKLTR